MKHSQLSFHSFFIIGENCYLKIREDVFNI